MNNLYVLRWIEGCRVIFLARWDQSPPVGVRKRYLPTKTWEAFEVVDTDVNSSKSQKKIIDSHLSSFGMTSSS